MKERCPICGAESNLQFLSYNIPHFGDAVLFVATCPSCGNRSTDVRILSETTDKQRRYELVVSSVQDLNVRVIRSSYGRIEIPELGVYVDPSEGESFISTVEGVLKRVERALKILSREEVGDKRKRAEQNLMFIEKIKAGKARMTLILDDPTGNSAIIRD